MPARTPALQGSLRVRSLEARFQGRADGHELMRRATALDARVQATFRRAIGATTPPDERIEAVEELAALRREFDQFLAALDERGDRACSPGFSSALAQLEPAVREQLAFVLGIP